MKTFLPENFLNESYLYSYNNNYYIVKTNNNCHTQYSTTYCDCFNIYPDNDYLQSDVYSCSLNSNSTISYNNFTSDFWYRKDLSSILVIFLVLFIFTMYMPYRIISRWFGRWLKV